MNQHDATHRSSLFTGLFGDSGILFGIIQPHHRVVKTGRGAEIIRPPFFHIGLIYIYRYRNIDMHIYVYLILELKVNQIVGVIRTSSSRFQYLQ
jgi:hypothetical protein